jgi:thermitase
MKRLLYVFIPLFLSVTFFSQPSQGAPAPAAALSTNTIAKAAGEEGERSAYAPGEILVKFKRTASKAHIEELHAETGAVPKGRNKVIDVWRLKIPDDVSVSEMVQRYKRDPNVEWAEPNGIYYLTITPDDTYYSAQQRWYYDLISAASGWDTQTGSSSVAIAIVDSGVDLDHPDLAGKIWTNPGEIAGNGIDDDGNGYVDDVYGWDFVGSDDGDDGDRPGDNNPDVFAGDPSVGDGIDQDGSGTADDGVPHGTMVAGIVGAQTNNGRGVTGMAWGCKLMVVRAFNPEGWGYFSDIADAITYAAEKGAKVINLSFGGEYSQAVEAAVNYAHDTHGCVLVAAAGNSNASSLNYPASLANTIAVGASDSTNGRAYFSNWGSALDVVAPGVDIFSTFVQSQTGLASYGSGRGTSFATPLVSGLCALIWSHDPSLNNEQVRDILKSRAKDLPDDPDDSPNAGATWDGAGIINAFNALAPYRINMAEIKKRS